MPSLGFDVTVFAAMVEAAPDVVIIVDHDGIIRFASSAMSEVLGHDPADLIGHPYDVLVPPDAGERHRAHHGTYITRPTARPMGRGLSLRARHKAGYDIPVEIALVPLPGRDVHAVAKAPGDIAVGHPGGDAVVPGGQHPPVLHQHGSVGLVSPRERQLPHLLGCLYPPRVGCA